MLDQRAGCKPKAFTSTSSRNHRRLMYRTSMNIVTSLKLMPLPFQMILKKSHPDVVFHWNGQTSVNCWLQVEVQRVAVPVLRTVPCGQSLIALATRKVIGKILGVPRNNQRCCSLSSLSKAKTATAKANAGVCEEGWVVKLIFLKIS